MKKVSIFIYFWLRKNGNSRNFYNMPADRDHLLTALRTSHLSPNRVKTISNEIHEFNIRNDDSEINFMLCQVGKL